MRARRSERRGVLLLVVLSMLVLFMLIGTAFLMSSSTQRDQAKQSAKKDRLGNHASRRLDSALLDVLRDTENPNSVVRYHSLLRDLYGTDGFQGVVYTPATLSALPIGQPTRFAEATAAQPLGPTSGQLIDIYVRALSFGLDDPLTLQPVNEATLVEPDLRHVLKLDRNGIGQSQVHTLPLTKGYYNGCLLTITSGPAAGQSTRIVDYEHIADIAPASTSPPRQTRLFRFRVMAFPRSSGQPLQVGTDTTPPARVPELVDLAGATFLVNGRAFGGTGVAYNPLAPHGSPRLSAVQIFPIAVGVGRSPFVGGDLALLPNTTTLDLANIYAPNPAIYGPTNWFDCLKLGGLVTMPGAPDVVPLNFPAATPPTFNYSNYSGPGGSNEGYDAPDFQNMALALQTVTPRAQGRVVQGDAANPVTLSIVDPALDPQEFLRLDLEDLPLPSFHRPDLVNFWYHRLLRFISNGSPTDAHVRALFQPYQTNGQPTPPLTPQQAALIATVKRKIMMRPIREDHPNFDGSNPLSVPQNLPTADLVRSGNISIPFWEAVGPWDVDNDNDGVPDSIWVDLGDPVQQAEDGTRYKPLYAFLIIDLDGRLNVNAHGLVDHINPANLAPDDNNLAGTNSATRYHSDILAQGSGYGPAEISLRPVFPIPWSNTSGALSFNANRSETETIANNIPIDSYATLLAGRVKQDSSAVSGKYGFIETMTAAVAVTPGLNYQYTPNPPVTIDLREPDLAAQIKFFDYPWRIDQRTAFGTPPDMFGRYGLALDYGGQPVYEVLNDANPNNNLIPRSLLTDTPYEIDLSTRQRRDTLGESFATPVEAFNWSVENYDVNGNVIKPGQNDDAPFATSDLERVLRAFDADSGTLPSQLWDVVDAFDPLKLRDFDPFRVTAVAQAAFGNRNEPERLAAAQQIAAINRRLVTTDSFDLPVPSMTLPNQLVLSLGPDGQPGRAGVDDDDDGGAPDEADELNAPISDDFRSLFGKEVAQATIFDLLRYRVWREMRAQVMRETAAWRNEALLAGLTPAQYTSFLTQVSRRAEGLLNGERFVDAINNGMFDPGDTFTPGTHDTNANNLYDGPLAQLLAPELVAGKRMDLNRPFGDGADNNANGVVDDPLEAGEPFLDVNGNGKYELGVDRFIDLDGNDAYTPPLDQLWATVGMGEPIAVDYTNGQGADIHRRVAANPLNVSQSARVRNLESQARQLYARHLYCLMLLLSDEGYIAPHDENDPQIKEYLDTAISGSTAANVLAALQALPTPPADPAQEARRIMLRKHTCRTIAQWAINCVDMRDSDAIMTPFEYDENPWDGWGTTCLNNSGRVHDVLPLDGDPATDENLGLVINWSAITGANLDKQTTTLATLGAPVPDSLDQTRGLVWGAERPELLIAETLAIHDRRTEDLASDVTGYQMVNADPTQSEGQLQPNDVPDLDQRLRPRGSFFVELFSPWSPQGQYAAELYSKLVDNGGVVGLAPSPGVEMGRLSTLGVDKTGGTLTAKVDPAGTTNFTVQRTPVWRMIVVEEHPKYRNDDWADDTLDPYGTGVHSEPTPPARYDNTGGGFFEPADPDFGRFGLAPLPQNEPYIERSFYFTSDNSPRFARNDATGKERYTMVKNPDDKLLIPKPVTGKAPATDTGARYFLAADVSDPTVGGTNDIKDVEIAPIKPGRHAVIGSAGALYKGEETRNIQGWDANGATVSDVQPRPRFVTTVSRLASLMPSDGDDTSTLGQLDFIRRIEMVPSPNPDMQQFMVANNGGTPLFPQPGPGANQPVQRDNEVVKLPNRNFRNIFNGDNDPDGDPDAELIPPCVAIPVLNMSVSEPLDVYEKRRAELYALEQQQNANRPPGSTGTLKDHEWDPEAANGEGAYVTPAGTGPVSESPYDAPFDVALELARNGTTRNYRTVHLQRLADPTLPWNPLPTLANGDPNPEHNAKLPVNLYRTIDTASVDLTAFNGASTREPDDPNEQFKRKYARFTPEKQGPTSPPMSEWFTIFGPLGKPGVPGGMVQPGEEHRLSFRSIERGFHKEDKIGTGANDLVHLVPRMLWRQEPETRFDPTDGPAELQPIKNTNDMAEWRDVDANTPALRRAELERRANDLRIRDRNVLDADIRAINTERLDSDFANFPDSLKPGGGQTPFGHCFDIVMDHSLGFQNETFGALITSVDATQQNLPTTAEGKPLRDDAIDDKDKFSRTVPDEATIDATFPWLAWVNRPYISANELLQVPATSSSRMLRQYSTINANPPVPPPPPLPPNPYDGTSVNIDRLKSTLSPFGHLLNVFLTASSPAVSGPDTGDIDGDGDMAELMVAGAPHFYRLLEYVQVPSRFVGTDDMLTSEIFNDVPGVVDTATGGDILNPLDPRYYFQPPFNKVSRERDPGRVNLNTVTGRREFLASGAPNSWSDVFDGIMQRNHDRNVLDASGKPLQLGHLGPAWRDIVLSRKGYAQFNADGSTDPLEKLSNDDPPDVFAFGLNSNFPTIFANPFRSPNAGDLVPLPQMLHHGIDASWLRGHHFNRGPGAWGKPVEDDNLDGSIDDTREAGFGGDRLSFDQQPSPYGPLGTLIPPTASASDRGIYPLFSESFNAPYVDGERNPYFYYQPMTRLNNLVTNRSGTYAIWITVGYFEVEKAPDWALPATQQRFGGDGSPNSPATVAAQALYNRVYPDGYMLGREVGSDTGDVHRHRGFYIVDRTEPVGFKPGEDLNVERMIRLRRRIE